MGGLKLPREDPCTRKEVGPGTNFRTSESYLTLLLKNGLVLILREKGFVVKKRVILSRYMS